MATFHAITSRCPVLAISLSMGWAMKIYDRRAELGRDLCLRYFIIAPTWYSTPPTIPAIRAAKTTYRIVITLIGMRLLKMYNKPLTGSIMAENSRRFEMMVIRHTRNDCTTAAVQAGITYIYSQPRYSFESLGSPCTSILKPCCVASIVCTHSKTQRIQTVPTVMMSDIAFFSSLVFT